MVGREDKIASSVANLAGGRRGGPDVFFRCSFTVIERETEGARGGHSWSFGNLLGCRESESILGDTFPMHGRMIHIRKNGEYVRQPQIYDARGRVSVIPSFNLVVC